MRISSGRRGPRKKIDTVVTEAKRGKVWTAAVWRNAAIDSGRVDFAGELQVC